MTGLSKDDFLEKLMQHSHRGSNLRQDVCPDSKSLVAFCEGTLDASSQERIGHHVTRCAECAEIQGRLLRFESDLQVSKSEWRNAEKRLGNWLDSLLRKDTPPAQQVQKTGLWQKFWRPSAVPQVRHAVVGVVVTLVVVAGVALRMSHRSFIPSAPKTVAVVQNTPAGALQTAQVPAENHFQPETARDDHLMSTLDSIFASRTMLPELSFIGKVPVTLPIFRIEPGTHAMVKIASLRHERDGRFSFQGLLIMPLQQHGTELFPSGSSITGYGGSRIKELTLETLRLPGVQLTRNSAATHYEIRGFGGNVVISSQSHRSFSAGKTVEFIFVRQSTYQLLASP